MRSRRTLGMAALISVLLGVPVVAMADTTRPYIVVFRDSAISSLGSGGQVDKARVGQLVRDIAGSQRIAIGNVFDSALGGFSARLSPAQVAALASEPSIGSITLDVPVQLADGLAQETIVSLAEPRIPAGVRRVGATQNDDAAINGRDGRVDVDIAIIDTGIEKDHPDLNVAGGYNCTSADRGKWNDGWGHGTHVAGIVGALDNGRGVVGVAPGARLWALKVLDNSGNGLMSWIVCGIDWITAQRASSDPARPRIEVANMSLRANLPDGGNDGNCGRTIRDAMHAAICRSVAGGTMYVVAAGNDARNANRYRPSSYQEALTVSALADYDGKPGGDGTRPQGCGAGYPDDTWAGFSNYGDVVDLIAPGICVLSTWAGGRYAYASGTSMAAPHVAGVAGLYLVRHPGASPEQVRMALRSSGRTDWKRATDPDGDPEKMVWATGFSRPPDFAVHASAPTSYAGAGSELAVDVVIDRSSGHDAPVRLTVEGLPPALSAAAVKTSRDRATVYVQIAGWAASGRYDATLVGSDGGVTRKSSFEILVDSAAPSASFGAPGAPARIQQHLSARVSWSESDSGGSGVGGRTLWRQRSSPVTPGSCSGLSFYNVGEARTAKDEYIDALYNGYCYRWNLSVRDRAGNRATVISGTVLVDTTMPSRPSATVVGSTSSVDDPSGVSLPSAYVDAEGTLWLRGGGSGTVDLRVEATDNQSGVASITLEPIADATGWTLPAAPLSGGTATARLKYGARAVALALSIRATNGAGERGNATTLRFAPDGKAPTAVTWRHPASQLAYTWDGEVDLIWSGGSDAGSGLAAEQLVRRERAPVTSTGGCGSFSSTGDPRLLANGYSETGLLSNYCYRWRLRTTDRVGNLADPVVSGKVLVDKVAPKVTVERPVVGRTSVKDVTTQVVEWSASDSGGSRMAGVRVQRQKATTHKAGTCEGATWKDDGLSRLASSPIKETGLTLGACYRWIVTATDRATNSTAATSGSVLISTAGSSEDPDPAPSGDAPSVGTVTLTLASGTQLTSTGMAWLDARWTASGGGSSLTGYELRLSSSGGTSWDTFATPNGATPSMALRLPAGRTYLLSVRARNSAGQWSSWSDARSYTVGLSQAEASSAYEKVGAWKWVSLSGASGGAVSSSSSSGAIIRYHFTGRGVALVATRGPDRGRADVYVDGYRVATIDLYSSTLTTRQVVFTRSWSTVGSHVVSLQIRSGRVDLDAAVVLK